MTDIYWEKTGQLFCRMLLNLGVSDCPSFFPDYDYLVELLLYKICCVFLTVSYQEAPDVSFSIIDGNFDQQVQVVFSRFLYYKGTICPLLKVINKISVERYLRHCKLSVPHKYALGDFSIQ